jgi:hypothetical protein
MIPVNARPLAVSSISSPGTFTFRKDSAGLGVPRDAFGELKPISSDVMHHGQVNTEVEHSVIGPAPAAFRIGDTNGSRSQTSRDASVGSRSVATFTRANNGARGNGDMSDGWSELSRSSMQRPATSSASSPLARPSTTQSTQNGNSSASSGGNHK